MKFSSLLSASAVALACAAPAAAQFTVTGAGGAIADAVSPNGNRCDTLPTGVSSFPLSTPVPSCASSITSVTLLGLSHSWSGDLQIVLENPNGLRYNLVSRLAGTATSCTTAGFSGDFNGSYTIVAAADPAITQTWPASNPASHPSGLYAQYYGSWISGSAGVSNTDLASIPAVPGTWTLRIFDGAGGDVGSLVGWCMDGDTNAGNVDCGAGGPIADQPSGIGGTWPTVLPPVVTVYPGTTAVSPCANRITGVLLGGLTHTWTGDLHIVLESPSAVRYNLVVRPGVTSSTSFGNSNDFGGNYLIVDPSDPGITGTWANSPAVLPNGFYPQFFGSGAGWTNGADGCFNTPLSMVPAESGIWTLRIYDAGGGDTGALGGWCLLTDNERGPSYCPGIANSTGFAADFTATGSDSIAANDLTLNVNNLPLNSFGFFIMGNACNAAPPVGSNLGTICVGGSIVRGLGNQIVNSGATGSVSLLADLQNLPSTSGVPSGVPGYAGQRIYAQYWYRDSMGGMTVSNTSNARFFILTP